MVHLGMNIDHVATLRQARYPDNPPHLPGGGEPDPLRAAHEAELGGADCITVHLREDRRHLQDRDLELLRPYVRTKLNLEMAATAEMADIARRVAPHMVTLVPEGRHEVTTEGGLDVASQIKPLREFVAGLTDAGIIVSAFIDADARQIESARNARFHACEVHTGPYAEVYTRTAGDPARPELHDALEQVADAGRRLRAAGMRFHAGHALNYENVAAVALIPGLAELHIGHAIVSRAIFTGLRRAVADMKSIINTAAMMPHND